MKTDLQTNGIYDMTGDRTQNAAHKKTEVYLTKKKKK